MGKLTVSMAIFNSYVKLPESNHYVDNTQTRHQNTSVYARSKNRGQLEPRVLTVLDTESWMFRLF